MSESKICVQDLYGYIELRQHRWVKDEQGRAGQEYLRIEYDKYDNVISRKVLEPVSWLSWVNR